MDDLIKALTILRKYGNPHYPTHCDHDELTICDIDPRDVSKKDKERLYGLGFFVSGDEDEEDEDAELCFKSFRFGSA